MNGGEKMTEQNKQEMLSEDNKKDIKENKAVAALSYLWILSIVVLILKKESKFCQFHAKQGLVLCVAFFILTFIPFIGWLLNLGILAGIIIGFFRALSGEYFKLPIINDLAEKIKF
ncbi:MAG: hypothetical protein AAB732_01145 [Patescibacteria group bacterium]